MEVRETVHWLTNTVDCFKSGKYSKQQPYLLTYKPMDTVNLHGYRSKRPNVKTSQCQNVP